MEGNGPTLREYVDTKVRHERDLREANERATALALALSTEQAKSRNVVQVAIIMAIIGPVIGVVLTVVLLR